MVNPDYSSSDVEHMVQVKRADEQIAMYHPGELEAAEERVVMVRLCGTSPDSSNARSLLRSLCLQIQVPFFLPSCACQQCGRGG